MLISILRFIPHRFFLGASSGTTAVHIVAHVNPVYRQLFYTLLALCDLLSYIIIIRFLYYLPSLPYVFVAKVIIFLFEIPFTICRVNRSRWPRGLRRTFWPFRYWDRGFESRSRHGCLCFCAVLSCVREVFAMGWSLVQRSPTACLKNKIKKPQRRRRPRSDLGCRAVGWIYRVIKKSLSKCKNSKYWKWEAIQISLCTHTHTSMRAWLVCVTLVLTGAQRLWITL
jgi:hypothetical protein